MTWKCFSKVLLALAPSHLLRADVIAFLDGQVSNGYMHTTITLILPLLKYTHIMLCDIPIHI